MLKALVLTWLRSIRQGLLIQDNCIVRIVDVYSLYHTGTKCTHWYLLHVTGTFTPYGQEFGTICTISKVIDCCYWYIVLMYHQWHYKFLWRKIASKQQLFEDLQTNWWKDRNKLCNPFHMFEVVRQHYATVLLIVISLTPSSPQWRKDHCKQKSIWKDSVETANK